MHRLDFRQKFIYVKFMPEQKLECVVFDFDGTLAELTIDFDLMRERVAALAAEYLSEPPPHNGLAVLEWIEELCGLHAAALNGFAERAAALVRGMEVEAARDGLVFEFTDGIFADLNSRGVKTAVITRNCTDAVRAVHPKIFSLTRAVITRDDAPKVKPDPAHLLDALAILGVHPGSALMVGDHPMDILTGKRAGTMTAGVLTGSGGRRDLESAGADIMARDAERLVRELAARGLIGG
jgi:phosphoglycolate phosphatase